MSVGATCCRSEVPNVVGWMYVISVKELPYVGRPDVENVAHSLTRAGDQLLRVAVPQQQRAQPERRQRPQP